MEFTNEQLIEFFVYGSTAVIIAVTRFIATTTIAFLSSLDDRIKRLERLERESKD